MRKRYPSEVRKNQRYHEDPDFRRKHLALAKASHVKAMQDPLFTKLHRIRNKAWRTREAINRLLERVGEKERRLLALTKQKEALEQVWKQRRIAA